MFSIGFSVRMTKAPKRLPLRCEPIAGESLSGFVHRLAERNGVRPSALLRILGERLPIYGNPRLLERLATLADWDVTELAAMGTSRSTLKTGPDPHPYAPWASVFLGQIIISLQLRGRRRAVCPTCLAEEGYHRAWWELHFVGACPIHRCGLLSLCPACNEALDWNTSSLTSCRCGQDMRRESVEEWHPIRLRATDYIAARLAGRRPDDEPACLRELPLLHTIELLRFFGALAGGVPPGQVGYKDRDPWLADYLNAGLNLLSMGPEHQLACLEPLPYDLDISSTGRSHLARWCNWIEEVGSLDTAATLNLVRHAGGLLGERATKARTELAKVRSRS
jgi:hypothetical protein